LADAGRQRMQQPGSAVALAPVLDAVLLDLAPLLTVRLAEQNLRAVLYNLLSNALKYHHPTRTREVHVRSWLEPGYEVLEVKDNGLGISPERRSKLFHLFQHFHSHVQGTGVGLYIVKRMVENAGGRVVVESEEGLGTQFIVFLPSHDPTGSLPTAERAGQDQRPILP